MCGMLTYNNIISVIKENILTMTKVTKVTQVDIEPGQEVGGTGQPLELSICTTGLCISWIVCVLFFILNNFQTQLA